MKNFEKEQVWKLKEYIWRYFVSSGKKHLFIIGKRQTGKTTLISALLQHDLAYGGIITRAVRNGNDKPDFVLLQDIHDEANSSTIAYWNKLNNNLTPCLEGFEKHGAGILHHYLQSDIEWIVIDEIGFLESRAYGFQQEIRNCLQYKRVIAALSKRNTLFLEELYACPNAIMIDLD